MLDQLSEPGGGGRSDQRYGGGEMAIALETNDPVVEALALQRLKELAPLALLAGPRPRHFSHGMARFCVAMRDRG